MNTPTEESEQKRKILVIGSKGFIGKTLTQYLETEGFDVEGTSSQDINLTLPESVSSLTPKIESSDHLVMLSCLTPDKGKGSDAYLKNILMAKHVCDALLKIEKKPHVIYFSSDAVYNFDNSLISEETVAAPTDLYGSMHRTRELMFQEVMGDALAIMRPTLVYGHEDSHNSYGPNRFRREAFKNKTLSLFGEGEDTRGHIFVEDLVKLTALMLKNKSTGVFNAAPPESISFMDLAKMVVDSLDLSIEIKTNPRMNPITHRSFDASKCYRSFPGFIFTPLKEGLHKTSKKMQEASHA